MTNDEIFEVWQKAGGRRTPEGRAAVLGQVPRNEWLRFLTEWPAFRADQKPRLAHEFAQPLEVDYDVAAAYMANHRLMKSAVIQGQAELDQFDSATREVKARLKDALNAELMSPLLVEAINWARAEVHTRESLGVEDVYFQSRVYAPGKSFPERSTAKRTAAHIAATDRAKDALAKLEALAFTPDAELPPAIKQIRDDLHAADEAALADTPARRTPKISDEPIIAAADAGIGHGKIEIESPRRERLSPVG